LLYDNIILTRIESVAVLLTTDPASGNFCLLYFVSYIETITGKICKVPLFESFHENVGFLAADPEVPGSIPGPGKFSE
jgi:hypothetical protein